MSIIKLSPCLFVLLIGCGKKKSPEAPMEYPILRDADLPEDDDLDDLPEADEDY